MEWYSLTATVVLVESAFKQCMLIAHRLRSAEEDKSGASTTTSSRAVTILDLGTGSGCVLLALLCRLHAAGVHATGTGIDCDERALEVANRNAYRMRHQIVGVGVGNGIGRDRGKISNEIDVRFAKGTFTSPLPSTSPAAFDVIVANPPYLDEARKTCLLDAGTWSEMCVHSFPPSLSQR